MKITTEPLEDRQASLIIKVDEERAEKARRRLARQISREVEIPGFRKGKAPYSVIVQRYGEEAINQELANHLAEDVYREALEQEEITPYAPGTLEKVDFDPLTFRFTVALPPKVDLGDYRSYRREAPTVEAPEQEVEQKLEEIREQNAILAPVDRPAAQGDVVVVDLVGRTDEGETLFEQDEARILLGTMDEEPVPGFSEAIEGVEEGEEHTFTLALPSDLPEEEWQDQEVTFTVKLLDVYERILPELDDDLARTVGNFDTFEELEEHVRSSLLDERQAQANDEYTEQVLQDIIEQAHIEYPPIALEEMLDGAVEDYERAVKRQAHMTLEDYLRIQGKTLEELREEMKPRAVDSLKRSLVLGEIVKLEELDVSEDEIDTQIEQASEAWGERGDELRAALGTADGRREMRSRLLANEALQRLIAIAQGEAPDLTYDEGFEISEEPEVAEAEDEASKA